jgi:phosphoglycolate phosphatase-like HAD superfamily hydrolase
MKDLTWVVLDIDGVLIDPGESYDRAVKLTGELLLSEIGQNGTFEPDTIREFRRKGKFGDDYRVTEGLVLAQLTSNFEEFINQFPRGKDLEWIREQVGEKIGRKKVKGHFDRFYFGGEDKSAEGNSEPLWKREEPLVDTSLLDRLDERFKLGYITGRSREEVKLAEEVLEYELSPVVTRDQYHKPDPRGLAELVGDETGVYVGDTLNDRIFVENYNDNGNDFSFIMADQENRPKEILERVLESNAWRT